MRRPPAGLAVLALALAALVPGGFADSEHPCQEEVDAACPDRPGPEIARCLKDKGEHERPIELSSECTDFVALNVACAEELENHCDSSFFSRDTALCLQEWTEAQNLGEKCAGVMQWAIPAKEEGETVTDELGMSAEDHAEKEEWRAKRKEARTASIEKMREETMSDADRAKENEKMERIKKENPEEYKWLMEEQKAAKLRLEEAKKHERKVAAAKERKRRIDAGLPAEETVEEKKTRRTMKVERKPVRSKKAQAETFNWLPYVLGGLAVLFVFFNVLNFAQNKKAEQDDDDKEE